ncbi:hypothetical protein DYB25_013124, partial [Aphanomyces astaci]
MTGIYPLSLDDITSKILRDKPGAKPPRTKMQATVPVETRVIVLLRTQGIDIDVAREIVTKVAEKETKKVEREAELKAKKKVLAHKKVAIAHAKKKAQEHRRETIVRKLMSSESTRKPIRRKRSNSQNGLILMPMCVGVREGVWM